MPSSDKAATRLIATTGFPRTGTAPHEEDRLIFST